MIQVFIHFIIKLDFKDNKTNVAHRDRRETEG